MPNGTYGGVRGRKTKVGRKLLRFPPTRFLSFIPCVYNIVASLANKEKNTLYPDIRAID